MALTWAVPGLLDCDLTQKFPPKHVRRDDGCLCLLCIRYNDVNFEIEKAFVLSDLEPVRKKMKM